MKTRRRPNAQEVSRAALRLVRREEAFALMDSEVREAVILAIQMNEAR